MDNLVLPDLNKQLWELTLNDDDQRLFVRTLDTQGAINIWNEDCHTIDVMVDEDRISLLRGMFHEQGISFSVAICDLNTAMKREKDTYNHSNKLVSPSRTKMDWKNYHRLETVYKFMDDLTEQYPYLCSVRCIGKSEEGRDLRVLVVSNGSSNNEAIWMDGSIHAREWITVSVVTYIADRLVKTFHELPDSITCKDWYFLPVMNPDGYEYSHKHDRMWRKNRAKYGECIGVDLNRNFSCGWGEKGEEGSSEDPGNIFFRGSEPFSEPETRAVKRVIMESESKFKVFISFHSYGEVIIFPWGFSAEPCPDYVELLEGGAAIAKAIYETSGQVYKVGSTKDLMYYACGTSCDWSYADANIMYSYMIELRGKKHRFLLPKGEIESTAIETLNGVFRLIDYIDEHCESQVSGCCNK